LDRCAPECDLSRVRVRFCAAALRLGRLTEAKPAGRPNSRALTAVSSNDTYCL